MKKFFALLFFLIGFVVKSQTNVKLIDTVYSHKRNLEIYDEYKKKFEIINKNGAYSNAAQKKIIKEINLDKQKEFLEDIQNDAFLWDNTLIDYLNLLFREVCSKNNINFNEYKVFLSKDSALNAQNYGDGIFVLNYGLLMNMDSEDELVFVIAHEIGHQYFDHVNKSIDSFAKISTSKEILQKTKEINNQRYSKSKSAVNLLKSISYQNYRKHRKKEIEADSIGVVFYKKTLRNQHSIVSLLEKLDQSDLEKDSLSIEDYRTVFQSNNFKIKDRYFEREASIFQQYDTKKSAEIDSLKTHPDCETRLILAQKLINLKGETKPTISIFFNEIKSKSLNQNLFNLFTQKKYGDCLYEALKLFKNDRKNEFYKNIIYKNLMEISNSKKNYTINKYVPSVDNKYYSNSQNRFISFINNIKIGDLENMINSFNN